MKLILHFRNGTMRAIYSDALRPLLAHGKPKVQRASHVEPCIVNNTQWTADMRPVKGKVLGPFKTRKAALAAEVRYLESNIL